MCVGGGILGTILVIALNLLRTALMSLATANCHPARPSPSDRLGLTA